MNIMKYRKNLLILFIFNIFIKLNSSSYFCKFLECLNCFKASKDRELSIFNDYILFQENNKNNYSEERDNLIEIFNRKIMKFDRKLDYKYIIFIDIKDIESKNRLLLNTELKDIFKEMYLKKYRNELTYDFISRISNSLKKNKYKICEYKKNILNIFHKELKKENKNLYKIFKINFNKEKKHFNLDKEIRTNIKIKNLFQENIIEYGFCETKLEINKYFKEEINESNSIFLLKFENKNQNIRYNQTDNYINIINN